MDNPSFMARVFHLYGLYLAFISLESRSTNLGSNLSKFWGVKREYRVIHAQCEIFTKKYEHFRPDHFFRIFSLSFLLVDSILLLAIYFGKSKLI